MSGAPGRAAEAVCGRGQPGEGADGQVSKEGRVRHGQEEEEEEHHAQQVKEDHQEALGVFQSRADRGESDVVAEGVAENRPKEVSCVERGRR